MAGDEPFYSVTAREVFEKIERHDDLLRDIRRDLRHRNEIEEREHHELHERVKALEGHTHDEKLSPPKNGNGRRREWTLALGLIIGGVVAAILRELGGIGVP